MEAGVGGGWGWGQTLQPAGKPGGKELAVSQVQPGRHSLFLDQSRKEKVED